LEGVKISDTIIIHPKTKEETTLFEYLAKRLNTPYEISKGKPVAVNKKPSDFFGSISEKEGKKMHERVTKSRGKPLNPWEV